MVFVWMDFSGFELVVLQVEENSIKNDERRITSTGRN